MNRKVLVTLLWKEIRDLELITEGFLIMTEYPEETVNLVIEKTESIQSYIQQLGQFKSDVHEMRTVNVSSIDSNIASSLELEEDLLVGSVGTDQEASEEEEVENSKSPSFIVDTNSEINIDDHFLEMEEELYLNEDEAAETVESVELEVVEEELHEEIVEEEEEEETVLDEVEEEEEEIEEEEEEVEEEEETEVEEEEEEETEVEKDEFETEKAQQKDLFDSIEIPTTEEEVVEEEEIVPETRTEETPSLEQESLVETVVSERITERKEEQKEDPRITDIKQAMTLGDRFRFQRDLFKGNGEDLNKTIKYLNQLRTFSEAISFLEKKYKWDDDDETTVDFYQLVKKRFI